jgi:hypothetical protein
MGQKVRNDKNQFAKEQNKHCFDTASKGRNVVRQHLRHYVPVVEKLPFTHEPLTIADRIKNGPANTH